MAKQLMLMIAMLALTSCHLVRSSDPSSLADFCVADPTSSAILNGQPCKDPNEVRPDDFFFSGLDNPANTSNAYGFRATVVNVNQIPGLNTLGISMGRLNYAPYGLNPPHYHPRATEILTVLEGSLEVGFITSNPDNLLISKTLNQGDVFVFPIGLIHYQRNPNNCTATAISGLSSQSPGVVGIHTALFGSDPEIATDILAKAFQVDNNIIQELQAKF